MSKSMGAWESVWPNKWGGGRTAGQGFSQASWSSHNNNKDSIDFLPWPNKRVLIWQFCLSCLSTWSAVRAAFLKPLSASTRWLHVSQKPQFETYTGDISVKKEEKKMSPLLFTRFSTVKLFQQSFVVESVKATPSFDSPPPPARQTTAGPCCRAVVGGCLCVLVLVTSGGFHSKTLCAAP